MIRSLFVGGGSTHLLFGDGLLHLRLPNSKDGWFSKAVSRTQKEDPTLPRVTQHDLGHTAASLAISADTNLETGPYREMRAKLKQ